jgi:histidinol-phosphate aminotransferase
MTDTTMSLQAPHGGPDALGVPRFDFSTNSNACGPCPPALAALQACNAHHYPDPAYTVLRQQLADFHGVDTWRVLLAGSASEFIYRITAWVAQQGVAAGRKKGAGVLRTVRVPPHAYGDYAQAALAWGLTVVSDGAAGLHWHADPSSPLGLSAPFEGIASGDPTAAEMSVVDCAYTPLRLSGTSLWSEAQRQNVWQLWTPNKALGLTGVRGAYAIAPLHAEAAVQVLNSLCPSWPVGAHGVALLQSWVQVETQSWLAQSYITLRNWKARQIGLLKGLGWRCLPSDTNFFCAVPFADDNSAEEQRHSDLQATLLALRSHGVKLRDAQSFGLPSHVRVSVQPPVAQDALVRAWHGARQLVTSPAPLADGGTA